MKKIVILSDTHGNLEALKKMEQIFDEADYILFAGDGYKDLNVLSKNNYKKLVAVSGNCDAELLSNKEKFFEIDGKKILLCHGDLYGVKSGLTRLKLRAEELGADVVIFGHTHQSLCETESGVLFINPGSPSRFSTEKTFGYLVIYNNKAVAEINRFLLN